MSDPAYEPVSQSPAAVDPDAPVTEPSATDAYSDADCPVFVIAATDRHAVPALRAYRALVAGDGVASADYVASIDHHIAYVEGWQATHDNQVMSPDQPTRSAEDLSVEPGVHVDTEREQEMAAAVDREVAADDVPVLVVLTADLESADDVDPELRAAVEQAQADAVESQVDHTAPDAPPADVGEPVDPAVAAAADEEAANGPQPEPRVY